MKWQKVKLGEVCETVDYGLTASANKEPVGPKFLRITDLQSGFVDWGTVPYCECKVKDIERFSIGIGDIVFARTGATTGKSFLVREVTEPTVFASYLIRVRPSKQLIPDYLAQYFQTQNYWRQIEQNATGTAQGGVNASILKSLEIPLPPLDEQKRIASILDAADALRRVRRQSLARLDELAQSLFLELFGDPATNPKGWEMRKLGEVCLRGGQYGSGASAIPFDSEKPRYLRITDIDENGRLKDEKVSPHDENWADYILEDGDLLFARSGATVGKTYQFKASDGFCIYAGYLIRYKPNLSVVLPTYISGFTRSESYLRWVVSKQNVVAQPNINAKQYGDLRIPLPPLSLQQTFAGQIEELERIKARGRAQLGELDALFASLQERAFDGRL